MSCVEIRYTVGFATMPTFSRELERTLHRALHFSNERRHEYATLEHLLLALSYDRDASSALVACGCDVTKLQEQCTKYIEIELRGLVDATSKEDSKPTAGFQRVIQRAVMYVQSAGLNDVNGAHALIGLFGELQSHALHFLNEQKVTKHDVVNFVTHGIVARKRTSRSNSPDLIESSIRRSAKSAPEFQVTRGRIRFRQSQPRNRIAERKAAVHERCIELQHRCGPRANEQPELKHLADKYAAALKGLRKDRGIYRIFLVGLELEILLKSKAESSVDPDRNPPLDADLLFSVRSLIVAHAGLVTLFPDIEHATKELDRYRELGEAVDAFRDRILDPVLDQLASSRGIFDEETLKISQEIRSLSDVESAIGAEHPSQGVVAAQHGWLRGALATIGQFLTRQAKDSTKAARDAAIKEGVAAAIKDPNRLTTSILKFLEQSKDALVSLADRLPGAFGWINSLLSMLNFK